MPASPRHALTPALDIAYEQTGPDDAPAILLLHGFPYDPRQYDLLRDRLAPLGHRLIVPYLRGYGPTAYRSPATIRSGQQAALAHDVLDLLDTLHINQATLVGYDWGARAACIVAALWPHRVRALISTGYDIQDPAHSAIAPQPARQEHQLWYQWYFQTERGRLGLERNRNDICRLLWSMWSPNWRFTDEEFLTTAASFANPDFVPTVIHSYRHRYANIAGDPALETTEERLRAKPPIPVPSITLHGAEDRVNPASATENENPHFTGPYQRRIVPQAGHCIPAEAPHELAQAITELLTAYPS